MRTAPKQVKYLGQIYKLATPTDPIDVWIAANGNVLARSLAKLLQQQLERAYDFKFEPHHAQMLPQFLQWVLFALPNAPAPAGLPPYLRNRARVLDGLRTWADDAYAVVLGSELDPETGEPKQK
jgi:hypothetical protein